jgi:hypothetical protein
MTFQKKTAPSAKSLDLSMNDRERSGVSPVNKSGQVTDKSGKPIDWPDKTSNPNYPSTGKEKVISAS